MSLVDSLSHEPANQLHFARFSRRLQALFIDWAISLVVILGALIAAASARDDDMSRALGIAAVVILFLYEPLLVSRTGGTIGHYLTNLRVVDEGHGGNISFLKATLRLVIKSLIGWYSFFLMAATRRNQAIHDLVTRSTVQIRDPAKASPDHFVTERVELVQLDMPSRLRRVVIICVYLMPVVIVHVMALGAMTIAGAISMQCIDTDVCSRTENRLATGWGWSLLAMCATCIVLGWKAKLPGARKARAENSRL